VAIRSSNVKRMNIDRVAKILLIQPLACKDLRVTAQRTDSDSVPKFTFCGPCIVMNLFNKVQQDPIFMFAPRINDN